MTKTTTTYALPDDARAEMRRVLENEFRPFLAHDPHDPDRFWGLAVDAVMRAVAREAEPVTLVPTEAWETWKRATRDLDYLPDWELVDAVDSLAQEVAR